MNLKNRWVHFRIRDVYLQGRVTDLSDNGSPDEVFVVVEVDGAANPVIIPAKSILGVI